MNYNIIYSTRKTLAIQITPEGAVIVRAPQNCSPKSISEIVEQRRGWIEQKKQDACKQKEKVSYTEIERNNYVQKAGERLCERTAYYAGKMGVSYGKITIREQKTLWGSCSAKGNLSYNWKLILMPEEVLDYIVVHELAHRIEMNHSGRFYRIVERVLPEYKRSQKWLKENGTCYV